MAAVIIFYGAGTALTIAIGILFKEPTGLFRSEKMVRIGLFFSIFIWMTFVGGLVPGWGHGHPFMLVAAIPSLFTSGPLFYWFFSCLREDRFRFSTARALHLLPALVSIAAVGYLMYHRDRHFSDALPGPLWNNPADPVGWISFLAILHLNLYLWALILNLSFLRRREYAGNFRHARIILLLVGMDALVAIPAVVVGDLLFLTLAAMLATANLLYAHVLGQRYPELIQSLAGEARKERYKKSRIDRLDTEKLHRDLSDLLEEEKLFCNEDLSLSLLAEELGITPHQLSQYTNERLGKNFNALLNEYRVKEAKAMLLAEPERSALSIAMAVGFNSLSVFYTAFRKETGMTPGKFRKGSRIDS